MDKITDFVKKHPYGTAIGVFVVGVIIILLLKAGSGSSSAASSGSSSGSDAAYYSADAAAIQSANQLQATQIAAQTQAGEYSDQLTAQQSAYAAQIQVAQLQAGVDTQDIQSQAAVQMANITASAQTQQQANTLAAGVSNNTISASLTENTNATNEALASINAQSQLSIDAITALTSSGSGYTVNGGTVGSASGGSSTQTSPSVTVNNTDPLASQITGLYQSILGRTPSQSEVQNWENFVASGQLASNPNNYAVTPGESVAAELTPYFTNSTEYKNDLATGKTT